MRLLLQAPSLSPGQPSAGLHLKLCLSGLWTVRIQLEVLPSRLTGAARPRGNLEGNRVRVPLLHSEPGLGKTCLVLGPHPPPESGRPLWFPSRGVCVDSGGLREGQDWLPSLSLLMRISSLQSLCRQEPT